MLCPNCSYDIVDTDPLFCPRCGTSLGAGETETTTELDADAVAPVAPQVAPTTTEIVAPEETPPPEETAPPEEIAPPQESATSPLKERFASAWLDVTAAACLAFLVLLCIGGVLLLGAKMQYPALGTGANAIEVLTSIAILALATLRAPIHLGNVTVTVLPLGALLATALGILWASRLAIRARGGEGRPALHGARIAIPFALICWLASLSFRFRGRDEIFAGAWGTLFWALVWGALFGALAGVLGEASTWSTLRARLLPQQSVGARRVGMSAAVVMLTSSAVLSAFALLLWVIVGLIRGTPTRGFGLGDALAALVYLVAFAPNVLTIITALGMGSALDVGARVTVARSRIGEIHELSIFSWAGGEEPAYLYLLLLIPLAATVIGGFYARRTVSDERMVPTLAWAAGTFAVVLFVIALLGDARLGGGLAGFGVAHVSVHAFRTSLLALLWGAAGGALGWQLAKRTTPKEAP
jgi:hypothetical protein